MTTYTAACGRTDRHPHHLYLDLKGRMRWCGGNDKPRITEKRAP